jgi:hypothetical protein
LENETTKKTEGRQTKTGEKESRISPRNNFALQRLGELSDREEKIYGVRVNKNSGAMDGRQI